jgi:hypothetical protein
VVKAGWAIWYCCLISTAFKILLNILVPDIFIDKPVIGPLNVLTSEIFKLDKSVIGP